jgi:hypothetical protein
MERRRREHRGHGHGLMPATGLALALLSVLANAPAAGAAAAPLPRVTVTKVRDGIVVVDGVRPCSDVSSASEQPGELRVYRSGPTDTALAVHYTSQPSAGGENDYEPLSGEVIIPAGAKTATIAVIPRFRNSPAPIHVHRTSVLTSTLDNSVDYTLGAASNAMVNLRFDIAVFECVPPVTPATTPTVPPTTPPATSAATATQTTAPAATLPFTGAPLTVELSGIGLALLALGFASVRYGRPRRLRIRAGWR